ncbi:hypothetical protein NFA_3260 [Nocardia farcinica IFM 10152]|uniref:Uncharacterized protein n=1 Tax=Nocardia farcinica (strain IFM 10152) TaxID=247156 RepID=Q5Z323_NOCFA|nr:hypothetical protein NFA_3260 [Nocardia farcinica IFM 10152]
MERLLVPARDEALRPGSGRRASTFTPWAGRLPLVNRPARMVGLVRVGVVTVGSGGCAASSGKSRRRCVVRPAGRSPLVDRPGRPRRRRATCHPSKRQVVRRVPPRWWLVW